MAVRSLATLISRTRSRAILVSGILALTSCAGTAEEPLAIATNLTSAETDRIDSAFRRSDEARVGDTPTRLVWLRVASDHDPVSILDRGTSADVLLGAAPSTFRQLQVRGRLESLAGGPAWRVFRRSTLGRAVRRGESRQFTPGDLTIDDPRRSRLSLAALGEVMNQFGWKDGYLRVLSTASHQPIIGIHGDDSLSRLIRGEIPVAVARSDKVPDECDFLAEVPTVTLEDGVGILRRSSHLPAARRFLAFLEQNGEAALPTLREVPDSPLLADLLGAVLVDAQPELIVAGREVDLAGSSALARKWLVPPPWPPASISKLRASDPSGGLVEALAEQIVPDFKSRVWLLESWKGNPRPIDGTLLREMDRAAEGRLVDEPRFRAWLAVEWRNWSRQCYRRVAREARRVRQ